MSTMRINCPSIARRLTGLAASAVLATAGMLATGGTAHAAVGAGGTTIYNDEPLYGAQEWHVDNDGARLIMQRDGNLVVYVNGSPRWAANTVGCGYKAVMQTDGNFVVYAQDGHACWESHTAQNQINTNYQVVKLHLGPNGTLTIYGDESSSCPDLPRNAESTAPYSIQLRCGIPIRML
ncbi:hypothetical protein [Streptomyces sp. WM6378]|uniref:hypothetical protein n=1 Tax=Streptomyces sp. WM6378 TaxID=1415557 RepID=UPI0006AE108D|nr:hypothetical protein [Streptomyces sp. WM6378]